MFFDDFDDLPTNNGGFPLRKVFAKSSRGLPWWPGGRLGRQHRSSTAAVGHAEIGHHGGGGSALDDAWRCLVIGQKNGGKNRSKLFGIDGFIWFYPLPNS